MKQLAILGGEPACTEGFEKWPQWGESEKQELIRALDTGWWGIGSSVVEEWEKRFSEIQGVSHCSSVCNGTLSLVVGLRALGIGPGDEVIVPPYTFLATASAVLWVGAIPVFADIQIETHNIDPNSIREHITSKTKAIIPVHVAGCPCDMDSILEIAKEHNLKVFEDAAQAHGATWKGKGVGGIGDLGSFSFQSSKNLPAGEGGMITTENKELWDFCDRIKNCGRPPKDSEFSHETVGTNARMSAFSAAVLLAQAERFNLQFDQRERNWNCLREALEEVPGVDLQARDPRIDRHALHLLVLRYDSGEFGGLPRETFIKALAAEGIEAPHGGYQPIYKNPGFLNDAAQCLKGQEVPHYEEHELPHTEKVCSEISVWIRQNALLGETTSRVEQIAEAIQKIQSQAG
ncbi:MAG: DegT/DnrJ/EryC1/StrS family aminotransferase, partial [Candidatus Omnitrophica bacterium]|nr:DegT/DnrJ/EryC1/StrS family aminotransferase [Candidatus Omnitrophota bacterium]